VVPHAEHRLTEASGWQLRELLLDFDGPTVLHIVDVRIHERNDYGTRRGNNQGWRTSIDGTLDYLGGD
jgi:hypothetical protein